MVSNGRKNSHLKPSKKISDETRKFFLYANDSQ